MPALIKKAAIIFLVVFIIYALSYASGFIAGKAKWVDTNDLMKSPVLQLSRGLEYKVPGYGDLLRTYRNWHNKCRNAYLMTRNTWGLGTLIYINNVFAANLTMIIRALFIFPLALTIFSKFFQGVMFAQMPGSGRMLTIFIMEFGGYFLTICGTLTQMALSPL